MPSLLDSAPVQTIVMLALYVIHLHAAPAPRVDLTTVPARRRRESSAVSVTQLTA